MKHMNWLVLAAFAIGSIANLDTSSAADAKDPGELVPVDVRTVFAPDGFDNNDETELVLDGYLPSSCYKIVKPEFTFTANNGEAGGTITGKLQEVGADQTGEVRIVERHERVPDVIVSQDHARYGRRPRQVTASALPSR